MFAQGVGFNKYIRVYETGTCLVQRPSIIINKSLLNIYACCIFLQGFLAQAFHYLRDLIKNLRVL